MVPYFRRSRTTKKSSYVATLSGVWPMSPTMETLKGAPVMRETYCPGKRLVVKLCTAEASGAT
jgi:hypothetical protein